MRKTMLILCCLLISILAIAQMEDTVQVSVTVEGTVFSLGLQDSAGAPWSGALDFGTVKPGESSFPDSVVIAACKSNTGRQWFLKVSSTVLQDAQTGAVLPENLLSVYVGDPGEQGQLGLPGNRYATGENPLKFSLDDLTIYSSNDQGDAGFSGGWGTFVPVGFGLSIPSTQRQGMYSGLIRFTMTE